MHNYRNLADKMERIFASHPGPLKESEMQAFASAICALREIDDVRARRVHRQSPPDTGDRHMTLYEDTSIIIVPEGGYGVTTTRWADFARDNADDAEMVADAAYQLRLFGEATVGGGAAGSFRITEGTF